MAAPCASDAALATAARLAWMMLVCGWLPERGFLLAWFKCPLRSFLVFSTGQKPGFWKKPGFFSPDNL